MISEKEQLQTFTTLKEKNKMKKLLFLLLLTTSCAAPLENASAHHNDYCEIEYDVRTSSGWVVEYDIIPCSTARHYYTNGFYHSRYQIHISDFYYYPRVAHRNAHRHYRSHHHRKSVHPHRYNRRGHKHYNKNRRVHKPRKHHRSRKQRRARKQRRSRKHHR